MGNVKRFLENVEGVNLLGNVRLKQPENELEKKLIFIVKNYNEVTKKCYICPINSDLKIPNEELVTINDIENV